MSVFRRYKGKTVKHGDKNYAKGTWCIRKKVNGRLISKSLAGARTEEEALRFAEAILELETVSPLEILNRRYERMSEPKPEITGHVYLIHAVGTKRYKIGYSTKPKLRIKALQTHSPVPLEIISVMKGHVHLEASLHARFHQWRVQGEWFEFDDAAEVRKVFELANDVSF
jgi:hypothetical protein